MSHTDAYSGPAVGEVVTHYFYPGYVVLSYFVSAVGSWTALEILRKRTSNRGIYNWYLLLAAATSTGAVAIWSMHYIGNRAIAIGDGRHELQIQYSPGYTAGSFFLPIIVVTIAFFVFNIQESVTILWTLLGGTIAGTAICGMHYMGLGGTANYQPIVAWKYVLGSAVVAVVASTVALGTSFYLKSTWAAVWWKRLLCALTLAVAVSSSHWIATVGTDYRFKAMSNASRNGLSRDTTVIVVLILSVSCCCGLFFLTMIGQRRRQRSADRAQQVVLACATFDQEGRLMVTPEGLLPSRKITNRYIEQSFDDVFGIDHPVFCWIFRASRCWRGVAKLVPGMRSHLRMQNQVETAKLQPTQHKKDLESIVDESNECSTVFKELFCVAAQELAEQITLPLENFGVLHDRILSTGTLRNRKFQIFSRFTPMIRPDDVEIGARPQMIFGRGQLLFVVRSADKNEIARLQGLGYCFASVRNVVEPLARSMQITSGELAPYLEDMRQHLGVESELLPGTHLACFALKPLVQGGFDVLVRRDARNLLPTSKLAVAELQQSHLTLIGLMDNWTVAECLKWLEERSDFKDREEQEFIADLYGSIKSLADRVQNVFFLQARLAANPLQAHNRGSNGGAQALVFGFHIITDIHQPSTLNAQFEFRPSRFFFCQQRVYQDSPDHEIFARRAYQEFSALSGNADRRSWVNGRHSNTSRPSVSGGLPPPTPRSPSPNWGWPPLDRSTSSHDISADDTSEKNLVGAPTGPDCSGIVSNETSVNIVETRSDDRSPDIELSDLGVHSETSDGLVEQDAFAEEWMRLTIAGRRQQR